MRSLIARGIVAAALVCGPSVLAAQSVAVLNPLGAAVRWQCFNSVDQTMLPPARSFAAPPLMMTFAEIGTDRVATMEAAALRARRFLIVGYSSEGELLLLSEMRLDTLSRPAVKIVDLQRDARDMYSGKTNASDSAQATATPLAQNDRRALTSEEIARAVRLGRELWLLRCVGPRV